MNRLLKAQLHLLTAATLACGVVACSGDPGESAESTETSTEAIVVAELKFDESTVVFEQLIDGSINVIEKAPPNAKRALTYEIMNLDSPVDVFRAIAPDQAVPEAMLEYERLEAERAASEPAERADRSQLKSEPPSAPTSDAAGKNAWFVANFCGFCGIDYQGCVTYLSSGSWSYSDTHKSTSWWYPETGNGIKVQYRRDGSLLRTYSIPVNEVWNTGTFHGGHGLFGYALEYGIKYTPIEYAGETVHTSAWFAEGDNFIAGPGCYD